MRTHSSRAEISKHLLFKSFLSENPRLLHLRSLLVEHVVALVDPQFLLHQVDMSGEDLLDLVYCLIAFLHIQVIPSDPDPTTPADIRRGYE